VGIVLAELGAHARIVKDPALISPSGGVESLPVGLSPSTALTLPTLAAFLWGCLGEPARLRAERERSILENHPWTDPRQVLAEVNGQPITRGEYYQRVLRKFGTRTVLSGILKDELFQQEARRGGITVPPEEVEARSSEMMADEIARAGGEAELREIYRPEGLTLSDVRRDYARDLESHLLAGKVTRAMRSIDEAALRRHYNQTYSRTRYRVRHIAYVYPLRGMPPEELERLKTLAREKALRTVKRVREGADFAQTARQESEDQSRETGGDIGYVSEDTPMDPSMKNTVFRLEPGEVSEPVENNLYGAYHVVQVTEIVPHQSYAEAEERMRKELTEREPDLDEIREALNVLRARASIQVLDALLEEPLEAGRAGEE